MYISALHVMCRCRWHITCKHNPYKYCSLHPESSRKSSNTKLACFKATHEVIFELRHIPPTRTLALRVCRDSMNAVGN